MAKQIVGNGLSLTAASDVLFRCPPDPVSQAQIRRIRPRGRWRQRQGGWVFPFEAAWQLRQQFGERFPTDPALQQWLDLVRCPLPPLPHHRELIAAADLKQPLSDGRQLLAYQRAGVRWLLDVVGLYWPMRWAWAKR